MRKAKTRQVKTLAKKYRVVVDREDGFLLLSNLTQQIGVNIGDEFASWITGNSLVVIFPKSYRGKRKIPKDAHWGKIKSALPEIPVASLKSAKPIPETLTDGWMFGSYTRYAEPKGCFDGDGFVIAPDGQRAELDWHVGTGKLKRTDRSDKRIWGVFEIGFPRPVTNKKDLTENFRAVLPQIKAAFARHKNRHA
ncbi:MAG: hypothetical protein ABJC04_06720 [Verrucomicrobiota bacterium]